MAVFNGRRSSLERVRFVMKGGVPFKE